MAGGELMMLHRLLQRSNYMRNPSDILRLPPLEKKVLYASLDLDYEENKPKRPKKTGGNPKDTIKLRK